MSYLSLFIDLSKISIQFLRKAHQANVFLDDFALSTEKNQMNRKTYFYQKIALKKDKIGNDNFFNKPYIVHKLSVG